MRPDHDGEGDCPLPLPRRSDHYEFIATAVEHAVGEVSDLGGQLGSLRSIRWKEFERLKTYCERLGNSDAGLAGIARR